MGGFLLYNNIHTTNLKLAREKQLADSIHVADSIAIAIAKQQRISDSIANNQRMNQNADNEIISRITDVINLLYKYSQENNLNDLQNLFSDNIEQYYSLKDINVEMVVKDREAFSKRFSLSSYQIDFSKLKVLSDKERTYFEVSYDITTVVNKLNSNAKTKFIESITMKLNNVYKIYYITEVVNSKEDI